MDTLLYYPEFGLFWEIEECLEEKEERIAWCWVEQDEAAELTGGPDEGSAEKGLAVLAAHCNVAAVTLGERGCLVQQRGGVAFSEPAASNVKVVDATGGLSVALLEPPLPGSTLHIVMECWSSMCQFGFIFMCCLGEILTGHACLRECTRLELSYPKGRSNR